MSGYSVSARNAALNGVAALGSYISLHTADPGVTGASECTGGTYARVQTTWGTASSGAVSGSSVTMVPTGTATYWAVWDSATAGSFILSGPLPAGQTASFSFVPGFAD